MTLAVARRRWGRKTGRLPGSRNCTWESWRRRIEFHEGQIRSARTPEAELAACFDRFRSAPGHGPATAANTVTSYLLDRCEQLGEWLGNPAITTRNLQRFKAAHGHMGKLRAAYGWYRQLLTAIRRQYGEDPEAQNLLRAEIHDTVSYLYRAAVALERAAEPVAA